MDLFEFYAAYLLDESDNHEVLIEWVNNNLEKLKKYGFEPQSFDISEFGDNGYQIGIINSILEDLLKFFKLCEMAKPQNELSLAKLNKFVEELKKDPKCRFDKKCEVVYFETALELIHGISGISKFIKPLALVNPIGSILNTVFNPDCDAIWESVAEDKISEIVNHAQSMKTSSTKAFKNKQRVNSAKAFKEVCMDKNEELLDISNGRFKLVKGSKGYSRPMILDLKKKLQITISDEKRDGMPPYKVSIANLYAKQDLTDLYNWLNTLFCVYCYPELYKNRTLLTPDTVFTHKGDAIVAVAPELFNSKTGYVGGISGTKNTNMKDDDSDLSETNNYIIHFVNLSSETENGIRYGYSKSLDGGTYYNEFNPKDNELLITSKNDSMSASYLTDKKKHVVFEISDGTESTSNYKLLGVFERIVYQPAEDGGFMVNYVLEKPDLNINAGGISESVILKKALRLLKENGYICN